LASTLLRHTLDHARNVLEMHRLRFLHDRLYTARSADHRPQPRQRNSLEQSRWAYSIIIYLLLSSSWIPTDAGRYATLFTAPYAAVVLAGLLKGITLDRIQAGRMVLSTTLALLIGSASGILADHFLSSLEAIIVSRYLLEAIDLEALSAMYLAAMPIVLVEGAEDPGLLHHHGKPSPPHRG